jgi:hypothetical protein
MFLLIEESRIVKGLGKLCRTNLRGMALYPFIMLKDTRLESPDVFNHELIHIKQMEETGVIGHALIWFFDVIWKTCKYRSFSKAYRHFIFEKEAYAHMDEMGYVDKRKPYAWLRKRENRVRI